MFNVTLTDLFDLRYNRERTIFLIPSIAISWIGKGKTAIWNVIVSWLNLELTIITVNYDHYCDKLEELIAQLDLPEEKKEEEE
jgi:hypothetical protein